ncbi:hypothetical protein A2643_02910 [Candidatus Nomurabacteria bacterium RIFCSPHIGHO2_01_FULL_39_220]|uniref:Uncharacterized protein n=1 Tax=Candidatus Nomurabacteria bacterium RIFCSPLOWO2_02_FULL_40_67 TaxID=1801787 RepID=A0A1F6Y642_9BACT|nr:MAG: hypothetical protein UU01_C0018G0009 [Parcubacteria group bacterium GW2011_GWA2_40_37]OGI70166.1 MAG: hypothetical protein A2643_02910 [Candidatus Nomurabacteria bacterium RIFCSPHIGHO2_01_FULL_39_220]OGI72391.1 MAG: hypothetical protein A2W56_03335 [Candidatus Nomurabacteria bacterium RIFCSPHIGHO2_02_41_18]OGI78635.1 MAG: hypothetical protein A3C65_02585 [Candidatus Nomurabacteria bacterium RIFCSPHIGHO2_02_FULL_41_150]OGI81692.1 MAG: hypothetical protein A3E03_04150 [Candidatus Nomuraba
MKILAEKEAYILRIIRDQLALNPLSSVRGVQQMVEEQIGRSISDKYVSKLMHKVRKRAVVESDRKKLNERFSEVRERYRVLSENLLRTIYWNWESFEQIGVQKPTEKERQSAIRLLAQIELALFRTELDIGMFEDRQLAISEMLKQGMLPTELHEQIIGVFRTWKLGSPHEQNRVEVVAT